METIGIQTSAMLVELNISSWTARKLDRRVSDEVDATNATRARAGNYNKNLLAGTQVLDSIIKYAAQARAWHNRQTIPWSDNGLRLLPMPLFLDYKAQLNTLEQNYNKLVDNFIEAYPNLVSAAAFNLGDLFNRDEYPDAEVVRRKFGFAYYFTPVPMAGDFRVDTSEAALQELKEHYESQYNSRLENAMQDVWQRMFDCLTHMKDRLTDEVVAGDVKKKIFRDSLIENAMELINIMPALNLTNDPKLTQATQDLKRALLGVDVKTLRDNGTVREDVRMQVEEILGKFQF
jgi:hypothetical protein